MTLCIGGPMDGAHYYEEAREQRQGWFETFLPQHICPYSPEFPLWPPLVETVETTRYTLYTLAHRWWPGGPITRFTCWLAEGVRVSAGEERPGHPSLTVRMPDGELRWYVLCPDGRIVREGWDVGQDRASTSPPATFAEPMVMPAIASQSDPTPETAGYDPFVESDKTLEESLALIAEIRRRREGESA